MDSKIPPDPAAAGGFPNSSDTNEDDEDEPATAGVEDEDKEAEEEEEDAGMEDPSISNNRTKTLTEKLDLDRRGRRRREALNKGLSNGEGWPDSEQNHVLPLPPLSSPTTSDLRRRRHRAPATAL